MISNKVIIIIRKSIYKLLERESTCKLVVMIGTIMEEKYLQMIMI